MSKFFKKVLKSWKLLFQKLRLLMILVNVGFFVEWREDTISSIANCGVNHIVYPQIYIYVI